MRQIKRIFKAQDTLEGAGVKLRRGFGYAEAKQFDPFLLFDDFSNIDPEAYKKGFPTHPHRGIETVTYIVHGQVQHKDSLGNQGIITSGQVQWMTAGSGIIHEEMPLVEEAGIQGFQLWINLPQKDKMIPPRYQDIDGRDIPMVKEEGVEVKVISGEYADVSGPVRDLMVSPTYLDILLQERVAFSIKTNSEDTFFVYVFAGRIALRNDRSESWVGEHEIALLTSDTEFRCNAGKGGARFLLVGGRPLEEPIAWHGPIVMNTNEEISQALEDLQNGSFVKTKAT